MRVTCLYIFCACNLAVVLWVSKRPCSVAGRTVVRQRRVTDEFRRRVDSPDRRPPLKAHREVTKSVLFSGHPSGLPCLVASCGVCHGGAHILDKPWASVPGSRSGPDSEPGTPHHQVPGCCMGRLCTPTVLVGVLLQCQPSVRVEIHSHWP